MDEGVILYLHIMFIYQIYRRKQIKIMRLPQDRKGLGAEEETYTQQWVEKS